MNGTDLQRDHLISQKSKKFSKLLYHTRPACDKENPCPLLRRRRQKVLPLPGEMWYAEP